MSAPASTVRELPVEAPASVEELVEVVRRAAVDRQVLVPAGNGSGLSGYAAPERADRIVSTRNLRGILSHEPDDGTLSALAGTPLSELRGAARAGGHFLTPDVPRPERATLGGVLAAGRSGPDRLRFGPVRYHVLGARVLLADGSLARSGGQLVKNVTGYDLHRLYCGSHGTLCILVDAALRLFPEPEEERVVAVRAGDTSGALALAGAALALSARLVSLIAERGATGWELRARLFGKRAAVEHEVESLRGIWSGAAVEAADAARSSAEATRDALPEAGDAPWLRVACAPSGVTTVLGELERRAAGRLVVQPGVALIDLVPDLVPEVDTAELAGMTLALRAALGGSALVTLGNAPAAALATVRPFDHPGPGLELMRALKQRLDPEGLLATGRFHPGL